MANNPNFNRNYFMVMQHRLIGAAVPDLREQYFLVLPSDYYAEAVRHYFL